MKSLRSLIVLTVACSCLLTAQEPKKVPHFSLEDVQGRIHALTDYSKAKAIVVMFIATRCPVSNAYNDRMVELTKDYTPKGVVFLAINSNKQEDVDEIRTHASDHGFTFPVLKDTKNIVADHYGATVTPEIFVVNGALELLYHGRIDDSQREAKITSMDLRIALDAILSGKPVPIPATKAFGCTIKRAS